MQTPTHSHRNHQNDTLTILDQPNAHAHAYARTRWNSINPVKHCESWGKFHTKMTGRDGQNEHFTLQNEHFTLQNEHFTLQPISRNRINKSPAGRWSTPITSITSNKAVPSPLLGAGRATLNQCL